MTYVFDNSPLSTLFRNYYRRRFPTLWQNFDAIVARGNLVSTREAHREIENSALPDLRDWANSNNGLFSTPTAAEGAFVARIYGVRHFQQNIEQQKLLKGGLNADPFVIARGSGEPDCRYHGVVQRERREDPQYLPPLPSPVHDT